MKKTAHLQRLQYDPLRCKGKKRKTSNDTMTTTTDDSDKEEMHKGRGNKFSF